MIKSHLIQQETEMLSFDQKEKYLSILAKCANPSMAPFDINTPTGEALLGIAQSTQGFLLSKLKVVRELRDAAEADLFMLDSQLEQFGFNAAPEPSQSVADLNKAITEYNQAFESAMRIAQTLAESIENL